ncbi:MAG: hypothetical protein WA014_00940, partial [Minisyncoccia bacterium]
SINNGVSSIQQTYGSAQTGALTFATSSASFNGLTQGVTITNTAGAFTFAPTLSGTLDNTGLTNSSISFATGSSGSDINWTSSPVSLGGTATLNVPSSSLTARGLLTSADFTTFNNKVSSTSLDTSAELASLVTDETGTGSLVFSASPTFTGVATFANASSSLFSSTYASSTNAFFGNLSVGGLSGILKATAGVVSTALAGTDYIANTLGDWTGTFDNQEGSYYLANSFSTTSANYFLAQNTGAAFSTTSAAYHLSTYDKGFFFSTTSTDYWKTQNNFFSTTSSDYWLTIKTTDTLTQGAVNKYYATNLFAADLAATTTDALAEGVTNKYFTDARVGSYISGSSTIPHVGGSAFGDLLSWTGSAWTNIATSTLGINLSDTLGTLAQSKGGTGITSYTAGDILYADNTGVLTKLPVGSTGQVLKVQAGLPSWGVDQTVGGGGSDGIFATSTGIIYPLDTAMTVVIGSNSTSTSNSIFEVSGQAYISSKLGIATTNPSTALSVAGNGYLTGGLGVGVLNTSAGTLQTSGNATIGGTLTVGSLSGFLKATAGVVSTALVSLTSDISGILPLANGGTATSTFYNGGVVFSDGTKLTQSSSASNFFWNETNKRLGIGTASPNVKLSVTGTSGASAGSGSNGIAQITTGTGATTDNMLQFGVVDGSYSWIQAIKPGTAYYNLALQPGGGNVGIGTTTPSSLLAVSGASGLSLTNTGAGNTFYIEDVANDANPFVID